MTSKAARRVGPAAELAAAAARAIRALGGAAIAEGVLALAFGYIGGKEPGFGSTVLH